MDSGGYTFEDKHFLCRAETGRSLDALHEIPSAIVQINKNLVQPGLILGEFAGLLKQKHGQRRK
jgi:hypothetical protein